MSAASNYAAAQRRIKIPNPLQKVDEVWKAAAGPTQTTPNPSMARYSGPPIQLAGTRPKRRRGAAGYSKGNLPG